MRLVVPLILFCLTGLIGCAPDPTQTGPAAEDARSSPTPTARLIIKFRDPTIDPTRPGYLRQLASTAATTLIYIRPMSGQAHVLHAEGAAPDRLPGIVQRLSRHPDVEYVEQDRMLRHQ